MNSSDHKEFIKSSYEEYKKLGHVECPAFNFEKVYFNKKGFRHLIYKNNDRRSNFEYVKRLELIKYCAEIIKTSKKYVEFRELVSSKGLIYFWSLEKRLNNNIIVLVIQQIHGKPKEFLSVMHKTKTQKTP